MPDLICYCFRVEKTRILAAIDSGCTTVDALSGCLRVATGCGGCRPDLETLLRFHEEENRYSAPRASVPKAAVETNDQPRQS